MWLFVHKVWNPMCKKCVREKPVRAKCNFRIKWNSSDRFGCTLLNYYEISTEELNPKWNENKKNADLVYFAPVARLFVHIVCHWDECGKGTGMLRDKGKYRKRVAQRYWFESRCYCENWTLHFRLPFFSKPFVSIFHSPMWEWYTRVPIYPILFVLLNRFLFIVCLSLSLYYFRSPIVISL